MKLSDEIVNSLSINLRKKISNIKDSSVNIEEIRLRVNKPMIINGDLKNYFYSAVLLINTRNGKRNTLAVLVDAKNDELSGLCFVGNQRCFNPKLNNRGIENLFFNYSVHFSSVWTAKNTQ